MVKTLPQPEAGQDVEELLGIGRSTGTTWLARWRPFVVGGGVALALAVLWIWLAKGSSISVKYIAEPVERSSLTVIVTATGTVQPTNQVDISSELSGTVKKVLVDFNSKVTVGQSLAELDTDKLEASVASARAILAASLAKIKDAEATVVEKELDYERKRTLSEKKVVSSHDEEIAKAGYGRALAAVESAKADAGAAAANLKLAETNLAKTCICSPINGVVLSRKVEPGQIVASSLQAPVLFSIAEDLTKVEVQVDVDEAEVGKVREGQAATFTVDAYPGRSFSATIKELRFGSEIVSGVVTYKAVLATSNPDLLLRPGMTATAEIVVQQVNEAVTVPNAALRFSPPVQMTDDRNFLQKLVSFGPPRFRPPSAQLPDSQDRKVWLLAGDKAKEVAVTIGVTDGRRTQIVNGELESGQSVIVDTRTAAK